MNRECVIIATQSSTHPSWHQTETTQSTTHTQRTLSPKLNSDQSKGFVTRRNQREISPAKQIRWQCRKLGLGVHTIGIHLHQPRQLLGSETAIQVNDGANANELDRRPLLQPETSQ